MNNSILALGRQTSAHFWNVALDLMFIVLWKLELFEKLSLKLFKNLDQNQFLSDWKALWVLQEELDNFWD